ncbi:MAG: hypothetical protein ACRD3B_17000 [Candidatus Sulfotelmatobacter sp.]
MQLGFENKKKAMWAAALGVIAVLVFAYEFLPLLSDTATPTSSAQAAAPTAPRTPLAKAKGRPAPAKKVRVESLDPTLKLDLLAMSEQTRYEGNGRNIFVSGPEDILIEKPKGPAVTDPKQEESNKYHLPDAPAIPPIPLKFYGFASSPGEAKKIFLKKGEDVFVAGEGEIVDRRYKVMHITNNAVEIQDMVNSGPPQNIPLTQG